MLAAMGNEDPESESFELMFDRLRTMKGASLPLYLLYSRHDYPNNYNILHHTMV